MIAVILLVVFIILFIIEYRIQRSFVAPVSLLLTSFILGLFFIVLNITNWEVRIHSVFVLCVFLAVLSFTAGAFLVELIFGRIIRGQNSRENKVLSGLNEIRYPAVELLVLSCLCMVAYFALMLKRIGFSGGFGTILKQVYYEATKGSSSSFLMHQMIEVVVAVTKISLFKLFLIGKAKKERNNVRVVNLIYAQLVTFAACAVLSTDRNIILRFFIYMLCLWIMFETADSNLNPDKTNLKLLGKVLAVVGVVAVLFFALGKMRSATSNFGRMMGIYGGSGLYSFNLFLLRDNELQFGDSTFLILKNTLQTFGLFGGSAADSIIVDDFIIYRSANGYIYSSNIYSAMRPYFEDFGLWGMVIYPLILGVLFETLYLLVKKYKKGFIWAFYAMMIYPVVYFAIAEQFFRRFHLGMIYEIGWFVLIYFCTFVLGRERTRFMQERAGKTGAEQA